MFKAIIFDFDGTLADSWEVINLALCRIACRYGYAMPSQAELEELKRLPVPGEILEIANGQPGT